MSILEEETVNPSLLYINPVRLDDRDTDYAFCARCNTFLPKVHGEEDIHRCPRGRDQQQDMGKVCPMCGMEFASHYGKNRHEKLCGKNPLSKADYRCG